KQSTGTGESERNSQTGRDSGLPFVRHGAGNQKRYRPGAVVRHKEKRRANIPIRLGKNMPGIFRLQQADFALGLFLWNLAKHIFGEVMLKLAEGSHPIVDTIEQEKNSYSGEGAEG